MTSMINSVPPLPMFPLKFCGKVNHNETRVMALTFGEDSMIVAQFILTQHRVVTDRRMVGQTESVIACTALCVASYAAML